MILFPYTVIQMQQASLSCVLLYAIESYAVIFCIIMGYVVLSRKTKPPTVSHLFPVLFCVTVLFVAPCRSVIQRSKPAPDLQMRQFVEEYKYVKEGEIIIGGVFTVNYELYEFTPHNGLVPRMMCVGTVPQHYKQFQAFIFAIEEINKNPDLLPNVTLGYHVYDSCASDLKAVQSVIQILSGPRRTVPNYSCLEHERLAGFIGDFTSVTTVPIAQMLGVYGYTQISYGATDPVLSNRFMYPHFFRTLPNDHVHFSAMSKLLKYFGWTWVGIITTNDDTGETESQVLTKYITSLGICVAFKIKINRNTDTSQEEIKRRNSEIIHNSSARVIILCGTVSMAFTIVLQKLDDVLSDKTLILPPTWAFNKFYLDICSKAFNGSLAFEVLELSVPGMQTFLENIRPSEHPEDMLLEDIWMLSFYCLSDNPGKNSFFARFYKTFLRNCTGMKSIAGLLDVWSDGGTTQMYFAVYAMAHALNSMHLSLSRQTPERNIKSYNYRYQLQHYVQKVPYKDALNPDMFFDEKGELVFPYMINNWILLPNESASYDIVGDFKHWLPDAQQFRIDTSAIMWKNNINQIPRSQCSDNCVPGTRKALRRGQQACCYDCVPCSEGEISNTSDSENCLKCPDNEWPNEKKDRCFPRLFEFLSYKQDIIAIVFSSVSVLLCLITALILGVFIKFQDTPIVKANSQSLSFILLVSIMLSFLCVFLFLGRPVDITCMLRQTSFGIIFSIAVSSVLAKTIMVCIAFKATKPGNVWRKWMGVKLSNSVVFFCSSIQVTICISWLSISPPFQELNMHSDPGKIIIQCNEGSDIAFYLVLGFMGILAGMSFIIAFFARNLPDSFNEAKYITFSMLVFCSVWIAMIPAYLSTKGKNMVSVEIFAILTSSAGLLGCIFFPKCYIILFRPEMNTKTHLLGKRN
ncbi:vomeronasal type-2 receptor 26-like [Ascaphus truei]|uniref:vomeronasal type-2 receptor 26-like n=1 Tax=Ascaphus truei TaxID=8439 RepID=UPI003F5AD2CE